MWKIIVLIVFWSILFESSYGQCSYTNNTFRSGEKVSYKVYYKLGFMWFNAAEVTFSINTRIYNKKKVLHFESNGKTLPNYDWIYRVRDTFQSYADSVTLSPIYFSRVTSEGNYMVNNEYNFDYYNKKIYSTIENSKTLKYRDTINIKSCTLDVLTAIYACRNTDITKLILNDTIPIKMVVDNKIYDLYLRYLGFENAKLKDDREFRCRKFTILMIEGTIFSGGEDILIWISDDKAKIPIKVEAQILVGAIIAEQDEIIDNKWPIESQIIDKIIKD